MKKDYLSFIIAIAVIVVALIGAVGLIYSENTTKKVETIATIEEIVSDDAASTSVSASEAASTAPSEASTEEEDEVDDGQWINDYKYILDQMDEEDYEGYALIYVDDDEIPELVMQGRTSRIYTWHDGEVSQLAIDADKMSFTEKGNELLNNDTLYKIKNGDWVEKEGDSLSGNISVISEFYPYKDMISMFKKGNISANTVSTNMVVSFNDADDSEEYDENEGEGINVDYFNAEDTNIHKYEFVVGDISWTGAYDSVKLNGSNKYLARITSVEEFNYVSELIKQSGLQNYIFWIGGARDVDNYGDDEYHWIANSGAISKNPITTTGIYEGAWASGEPTRVGNGDVEKNVAEDKLCMFYDLGTDKFYWRDAPDKILKTSPSLAGKIAFIVESEE